MKKVIPILLILSLVSLMLFFSLSGKKEHSKVSQKTILTEKEKEITPKNESISVENNQSQEKLIKSSKQKKLATSDSPTELLSYQESIDNAFKDEKVTDLDTLFKLFTNTKSISRKAKLSLIWQMMKKTDSEYNFRYLAETLGSLNPAELSEEIIKMINETDTNFKKVELINILDESLTVTELPNDTSEEGLRKLLNTGGNVKAFLLETLHSETDKDIFDAAFSSFSSIATPQELVSISTELLPNRDTNISKDGLTNTLLQKTLMDKNLQNNLLPEILSDSYPKDEDFDDTLSFWTKEFGRESFSPQTITLLKERVEKSMQNFSSKKIEGSGIEGAKLHNNILAIAELNRSEEMSVEQAYVNYTLDNFTSNPNDAIKLTSAIADANDTTLELFKQRKDEIIPILSNSLEQHLVTREDFRGLTKEIIILMQSK